MSRACRRFASLSALRRDMELQGGKRAFFEAHLLSCEKCARDEVLYQAGLETLVKSELDACASPDFQASLEARLQRENARRSPFGSWSPALIGASVAALAFLTVLQLLANPVQLKPMNTAGTEARMHFEEAPQFPRLDFGDDKTTAQ